MNRTTRHLNTALIASLALCSAGAMAVPTWTYTNSPATYEILRPSAIAADSNGIWISGRAGNLPALAHFDNNGNLLSHVYDVAHFTDGLTGPLLTPLADGGVMLTPVSLASFFPSICTLERFDAQGNSRWFNSAPAPGGCGVQVADANTNGYLQADNYYRVNIDGTLSEIASGSTPYIAVDQRNGDVYVETSGAGLTPPITIERYHADGTQDAFFNSAELTFTNFAIAADGTFYGFTGTALVSIDSVGTVLTQKDLGGTNNSIQSFFTSDGHFIESEVGGIVLEYDNKGMLLFSKQFDATATNIAAATASGDVAVLSSGTQNTFTRLDATGGVLFSTAIPALAPQPSDFVQTGVIPLSDDTVLLGPFAASSLDDPTLLRYDAQGNALSAPDLDHAEFAAETVVATLLGSSGTLYFLTQHDFGADNGSTFWLTQLAANGSLVAKTAYNNVENVQLSANAQNEVCVGVTDNGGVFTTKCSASTGETWTPGTFDTVTGEGGQSYGFNIYLGLQGAFFEEQIEDDTFKFSYIEHTCGYDACYGATAFLSHDLTLRTLTTANDPHYGYAIAVDANANISTPPPNIRVDQSGIAGAWYAPSESGSGFTLDYLPQSNFIFMPYFVQDGVVDPSGLAWSSFQGNVQPGATTASLTWSTPDAVGMFNSGIVGQSQIGIAELSFTDCNHGVLNYQSTIFSPNFRGAVPIQRLSPSTSPCVLADGTTSPAQNSAAPSNGFDARQSGSWYDPNTSGQGLEIGIAPASSTDPGLIFATWYTFDPPPGNDSLHEHWFTLEGSLTGAKNGTVILPIIQTIGSGGFATHNTLQVGTATLTMQSCTRATLAYRFDNSVIAHAFAGLSGTLNLQKLNCDAP